ncbi:MAG: hypothetical protein HC875_38880 [Anaerolineales bacterium]|nr:hypothetical protein [Anaerolineales bacterium]
MLYRLRVGSPADLIGYSLEDKRKVWAAAKINGMAVQPTSPAENGEPGRGDGVVSFTARDK